MEGSKKNNSHWLVVSLFTCTPISAHIDVHRTLQRSVTLRTCVLYHSGRRFWRPSFSERARRPRNATQFYLAQVETCYQAVAAEPPSRLARFDGLPVRAPSPPDRRRLRSPSRGVKKKKKKQSPVKSRFRSDSVCFTHMQAAYARIC